MATLSDLKEVKAALDAGLVSQAEYDDVKRKYLRGKEECQKLELQAKKEALEFQKRKRDAELRTYALESIVKHGSSIMSEEQKNDLVRDYLKVPGLDHLPPADPAVATVKVEPASKRQRPSPQERDAAPLQTATPPRTPPAAAAAAPVSANQAQEPAPSSAGTSTCGVVVEDEVADIMTEDPNVGLVRDCVKMSGLDRGAEKAGPSSKRQRVSFAERVETPPQTATPPPRTPVAAAAPADVPTPAAANQAPAPTAPGCEINTSCDRGYDLSGIVKARERRKRNLAQLAKAREKRRSNQAPEPALEARRSPSPAAPDPAAPDPAAAGTSTGGVVVDDEIFLYNRYTFSEYLEKNADIITEDWLHAALTHTKNNNSFNMTQRLFEEAARLGYVRIFTDHATEEFLHAMNTNIYRNGAVAIGVAAAKSSHLDVLKWLRSQNPPCPWNALTCRDAAKSGHMDVLKWLRSQDPPCPWSDLTCSNAASKGHLDVLKWLRSQKPRCPWSEETCSNAASEGHLDVVKWLRSKKPRCPWGERTCSNAAGNSQLHVLKWLRSQNPPCPWSDWTCTNAARSGHLNMLKWLRSQDPPCPWDEYTCKWAAKNGHLDVLKWLRSQDPPCPWDERTCKWAAENGHLDVVKWLRSQDPPCPWDKETSSYAAQSGHLDVLKWLIDNGCPYEVNKYTRPAYKELGLA